MSLAHVFDITRETLNTNTTEDGAEEKSNWIFPMWCGHYIQIQPFFHSALMMPTLTEP